MSSFKCCKPVYFRHEDGWDVYPKSECHQPLWAQGNTTWIPRWFDEAIIEDAPTKLAAQKEMADLHPFGLCLNS